MSGIPAYAHRALPGARAYIAKLKAIAPPSDKRVGYQQYLAGGEREVALLAGASTAVRAGDARPAAAFAEQLSAQVKLDNAKASSLGLKGCARG